MNNTQINTLREIENNKAALNEQVIKDVNAKYPPASDYHIIPEEEVITHMPIAAQLKIRNAIKAEVKLEYSIQAKIAAGLIKKNFVITETTTTYRMPHFTESAFFARLMVAGGLVSSCGALAVLQFNVTMTTALSFTCLTQLILGASGSYLAKDYETYVVDGSITQHKLYRLIESGDYQYIRTLSKYEDPGLVVAILDARESAVQIADSVSKTAVANASVDNPQNKGV